MSKYDKATPLKEGFLVKKGHVRHNWKTRWFALHEDHLAYYSKNDRITPVGVVFLRGASVVFPVPEYDKRMAVFKLSLLHGREYLLQAPTETERDKWTYAISAVIRAQDSTMENDEDENGHYAWKMDKINLSDLLGAMQDPDAGIDLVTQVVDNVVYKNCFAGKAIVNWVMKWAFVSTREEGVVLAEDLLKLAHILPLPNNSSKKKTDVSADLTKKVHDSQEIFYRFTSLNVRVIAGGNGDDDSSSGGGESEDDILDDERLGKGKLVKQGILMKKCVVRKMKKKWKARRVILREFPPSIEFYSTSKDQKIPLKLLDMSEAQALDLEEDSIDECDGGASKKKKHLFCIKRPETKTILLQAEDQLQKQEWIKAIKQLSDLP